MPDAEAVVLPYPALFHIPEYDTDDKPCLRPIEIIGERVTPHSALWWIKFIGSPRDIKPVALCDKSLVYLRRCFADGRVRLVSSVELKLELAIARQEL